MEKIYTSKKQIAKLNEIVEKEKAEKVTFELVMTALFPSVFNNILKELEAQYTKGYIDGLNENKRNSI